MHPFPLHPARLLRILALTVCVTAALPLGAAGDKASRFFEDGLARFDRKDYAGAAVQLKNALQQDERMLAAHVLLGRTLYELGDLTGAETALRTALALGVAPGEVELPLVRTLFAQGKYGEITKRPMPPVASPALRAELLAVRGSALAELNDVRGAARAFEEARALDPASVPVMLAQASHAIRIGRIEDGLALTQRATLGAPQNPDAWSTRGAALVAAGQTTPALDAFGKALALDERQHEARLGRVSGLLELGRDAEAGKDLDAMRKLAPGDARAAYLRGVLAARRGDSAAVQREMSDVVKLVDTFPAEVRSRRAHLLFISGMAHYSLRNSQKALESFEGFLRLQPGHPGATRMLASQYLALGQSGRAATLLEDHLRRVRDPQASTLLASAYLAQKRYAKAAQLMQDAMAQGAADPATRAALGASMAGLGQDELARQHLRAAHEAQPDDPATGMAYAMQLLRAGEGRAAVPVLQTVIARNPRNPALYNLLGVAHVRVGTLPEARKAFEAALEVEPKFDPSLLNLARLDVLDGKPEAARQRLLVVLKSRPGNADALIDLAQIERSAGRRDEALRHLEKATAVAPRHARAALMLIEARVARGDAPGALDAARTAVAAMPGNLPVRMELARRQIAAQDIERARDTLNEARKLAEYDVTALNAIAQLQVQVGHFAGAAYSLDKALGVQPDNLGSLALQGDLLLRQGDLAGAERIARVIAETHPKSGASQHLLGDVALSRKRPAEGIALHRAAYQREPGTESALRVFRAYIAIDEPAKGVAFLRERSRTHSPETELVRALAEGQIRAGDWAGARATLEALAAQSPDARLLNNLALVLLELRDPRAIEVADRAVALAPTDPSVLDTLGWVLVRNGQAERGLKVLRDARLRSPESAEIRFHLSWALAQAGRVREAREELSAAGPGLSRVTPREEVQRLSRSLGL